MLVLTACTLRGEREIPDGQLVYLGDYFYQYQIPCSLFNDSCFGEVVRRIKVSSSPTGNIYMDPVHDVRNRFIAPFGIYKFNLFMRFIGQTQCIIEVFTNVRQLTYFIQANIVDY